MKASSLSMLSKWSLKEIDFISGLISAISKTELIAEFLPSNFKPVALFYFILILIDWIAKNHQNSSFEADFYWPTQSRILGEPLAISNIWSMKKPENWKANKSNWDALSTTQFHLKFEKLKSRDPIIFLLKFTSSRRFYRQDSLSIETSTRVDI